jgi:hypothetical protein
MPLEEQPKEIVKSIVAHTRTIALTALQLNMVLGFNFILVDQAKQARWVFEARWFDLAGEAPRQPLVSRKLFPQRQEVAPLAQQPRRWVQPSLVFQAKCFVVARSRGNLWR